MSLTRKLKKSEVVKTEVVTPSQNGNGKQEKFDMLLTHEVLQEFDAMVDANIPGLYARPIAHFLGTRGKKMPRKK